MNAQQGGSANKSASLSTYFMPEITEQIMIKFSIHSPHFKL